MIALCLGGAPSVWDDLARAQELVAPADRIIVACNHMGFTYPGRIDAWATLHPELLADWRESRAAVGFNTDYRAFVHPVRGHDGEPIPERWHGSSGLYMAQIAIEALGASGAILCGAPMDPEAGHITGAAEWPHADQYRPGFVEAKAAGLNVRSMSGWTAELLGEPDGDWLSCQGIEPARERPRPARKEIAMRVKFLRDRKWTPPEDRRIGVAYKKGMELTVKREWGERMVLDGDCEEIAPPARGALDHDGDGRKGGAAPKKVAKT